MSFSHNIEDYPEGIILAIDKPYRWTSADVVRKVKYAAKRHFGKKNLKVGHAGTLDPLATGILLVCIGPSTKKAETLQASEKTYIAGVSFGATTPSFDLEKDIDRLCPLDRVSKESLEAVLPSFLGEQDQVAPIFSAKSVDGVRAYETARKLLRDSIQNGVEFDHSAAGLLQTNRIHIYSLRLLEYQEEHPRFVAEDVLKVEDAPVGAGGEDPKHPRLIAEDDRKVEDAPVGAGGEDPKHPRLIAGGAHEVGGMSESEGPNPPAPTGASGRINVANASAYNLPTAKIEVRCSKGTYIRALARDLGEALGSGAFLSSLRRTGNGGFTIEQAITIDEALKLLD